MTQKLFILAALVIVGTNVVVLSGAAYNRSTDEPRETVLTERELRYYTHLTKENSGVSLSLRWRVFNGTAKMYNPYEMQASWLDGKKLSSLGFVFDAKPYDETRIKQFRRLGESKEVFLVLEYDDAAYREVLERAETRVEEKAYQASKDTTDTMLQQALESARYELRQEQTTNSRLFVIDAGIDPMILQEHYSDPTHYIIAKGIVKAYYDKTRGLYGHIQKVSVNNIHVELQQRRTLDKLTPWKQYVTGRSPRYAVRLAYGRRYEPWIVSIDPLDTTSD